MDPITRGLLSLVLNGLARLKMTSIITLVAFNRTGKLVEMFMALAAGKFHQIRLDSRPALMGRIWSNPFARCCSVDELGLMLPVDLNEVKSPERWQLSSVAENRHLLAKDLDIVVDFTPASLLMSRMQ